MARFNRAKVAFACLTILLLNDNERCCDNNNGGIRFFFHVDALMMVPSSSTQPRRRYLGALDASISTADVPVLSPNRSAPSEAEILSKDPLIYKIPNLLSPSECQTLLSQVQVLENEEENDDGDSQRMLKRSNPPQVSLEIAKLWPLPFLSILAGIPPLIRYYEQAQAQTQTQEQAQAVPAASFTDILSQLSPSEVFSMIAPPIGAALALSLLLAFGVILPLIKQISNTSSRTSLAVALNQERDFPSVQDLIRKVCTATRHDWSQYEAPVLTYYPPGALFAKHADASPTRGSEWKEEGGQRVVTCICYLNTIIEGGGGETRFDQLGIDVSPEQGSALVFFPTLPGDSLEADPLLTHESLPSETSEKYIIQMFGRVGRVPPPLGLPYSFGAVVTKSSDN